MPQLDFTTFANSIAYLYCAWFVVLLLAVVATSRVARLMGVSAFRKYSIFSALLRYRGIL